MEHWIFGALFIAILGCTDPRVVEQRPISIDLGKVNTDLLRSHNAQLLKDPRYIQSILRGANKVEPSKVYNTQTLQDLVDTFERRSGTVVLVPFEEQMKIKLPLQADFYPVCKGGINRSQVTYVVLKELTKGRGQTRVELPHGVAIGYESSESKPMAYENQAVVTTDAYTPLDLLAGNKYFAAAMSVSRPKRFGYDHTETCEGTMKTAPLNCNTKKQRLYFADRYWGRQNDVRKVYITYGSAGVITLERADPTNTTVIIFAMEDFVSEVGEHNPGASQEDFVDAYQQMRGKISSVLKMD